MFLSPGVVSTGKTNWTHLTPPERPERILLVDDEPDILDSLSFWLKDQGFDVSVAGTWRDALARCENEEWDLVITDIRMPQGSGLALVEALNRIPAPHRPVIFTMSGYHDLSGAEVYERGIDLALEKPVDLEILDQAARHFLKLRREQVGASHQAQEVFPFLAGLGHDLKTPVNAIVGYASLLEATLPDDITRRYAGSILKAADSLVSLVNAFLETVQAEHDLVTRPPTSFALTPMLESILETASGAHGRANVTATLEVGKNIHEHYRGHALRIQQVLTNLLSNSLKYTFSGHVRLFVDEAGDFGAVRLVFTIEDTGVGIPQEILERLGTPFLQTRETQAGGHGLGLFTVRRLLDSMEGTWHIESSPGKGTRVRLEIPVLREEIPPQH